MVTLRIYELVPGQSLFLSIKFFLLSDYDNHKSDSDNSNNNSDGGGDL
jgi:hypothetical protein